MTIGLHTLFINGKSYCIECVDCVKCYIGLIKTKSKYWRMHMDTRKQPLIKKSNRDRLTISNHGLQYAATIYSVSNQ